MTSEDEKGKPERTEASRRAPPEGFRAGDGRGRAKKNTDASGKNEKKTKKIGTTGRKAKPAGGILTSKGKKGKAGERVPLEGIRAGPRSCVKSDRSSSI